jgi:hypothetical protein
MTLKRYCIITDCYSCPYAVDEDTGPGYECIFKKTKIRILSDFPKMPEWCPLPIYKKPKHVYIVKKPFFPCIKKRKLAFNDISDDMDDFSRLDIPVNTGDRIMIYSDKNDAKTYW